MSDRPSLDNYIDVAERIVAFNKTYPEGSLQTVSWEIKDIGDRSFVVYRAAAFRTPDDKRPGHGIAWEPFPGTTPYTKNSELMNAETAAWGRAIVACGLTSNRKLASRQEVEARQAEREQAQQQVVYAHPEQQKLVFARAKADGVGPRQLANAIRRAANRDELEDESEQTAREQVDFMLKHLPPRLVNPVLEQIAKVAEDVPDMVPN